MSLTKVTTMKAMPTRMPLDERSFEQLLAAAYLAQQRRQPHVIAASDSSAKSYPAMSEAERLTAIAEAHTIVHGTKLHVQQTLQLVTERALRITGGSGAAIWLLRGPNAVCQSACGVLTTSAGQQISVEGSRLTPCLRDGAVVRCEDAMADPRARYDALPGVAEGSVVAVPVHYEGQVQGALEVTFASARGFEEADVRTCQILSGLVSETVAIAAGQERKTILDSERATLLQALDQLQPHLSKLLSGNPASPPAQENAPLPEPPVAAARTGPTPGVARLGKYLMAQLQEQESDATAGHRSKGDGTTLSLPREVQTALNFSVASNRPAVKPSRQHEELQDVDYDLEVESHNVESHNNDLMGPRDKSLNSDPARRFEVEPYQTHPYDDQPFSDLQPEHSESTQLTIQEHNWHGTDLLSGDLLSDDLLSDDLLGNDLHGKADLVLQDEALGEKTLLEGPAKATTFLKSHWADVCLATAALLLAASLTWAFWPQPKRFANATDPSSLKSANPTASDTPPPAEPQLTAFEQFLVSMGLAEAPSPAATYTGTPTTKVWVDTHNALYYCPGAEPYGNTPKGMYLTQHDAQVDNYQPARGQPCD